jgi:hypothetical protein
VIQGYNAQHLNSMKNLLNNSLSETQFAQIIGKARCIITTQKEKSVPELLWNDGHINTVAKDYYQDESFCRNANGDISMWGVLSAHRAIQDSYVDTFLERRMLQFSEVSQSTKW